MIYDGREYLLTQRGTGNVGNVGGNAKLRREGAAHNTTKPKTRVGRDLLARPLTATRRISKGRVQVFFVC